MAFFQPSKNLEIYSYLLKQGAKINSGPWEGSNGTKLFAAREEALALTRMAMTNGLKIDFIRSLDYVSFDILFKAVCTHPDSLPGEYIWSQRSWIHWLGPPGKSPPLYNLLGTLIRTVSFDDLDFDEETMLWAKWMKQFSMDMCSVDRRGQTCWSEMFGTFP